MVDLPPPAEPAPNPLEVDPLQTKEPMVTLMVQAAQTMGNNIMEILNGIGERLGGLVSAGAAKVKDTGAAFATGAERIGGSFAAMFSPSPAGAALSPGGSSPSQAITPDAPPKPQNNQAVFQSLGVSKIANFGGQDIDLVSAHSASSTVSFSADRLQDRKVAPGGPGLPQQ